MLDQIWQTMPRAKMINDVCKIASVRCRMSNTMARMRSMSQTGYETVTAFIQLLCALKIVEMKKNHMILKTHRVVISASRAVRTRKRKALGMISKPAKVSTYKRV